mmetsp:Transcript_110681/g.278283  ORF Transcript_110681/g.278283 Transcript_110681/m.278283 type:complete len:220 (+) Transcript_110681:476-1135(+)
MPASHDGGEGPPNAKLPCGAPMLYMAGAACMSPPPPATTAPSKPAVASGALVGSAPVGTIGTGIVATPLASSARPPVPPMGRPQLACGMHSVRTWPLPPPPPMLDRRLAARSQPLHWRRQGFFASSLVLWEAMFQRPQPSSAQALMCGLVRLLFSSSWHCERSWAVQILLGKPARAFRCAISLWNVHISDCAVLPLAIWQPTRCVRLCASPLPLALWQW